MDIYEELIRLKREGKASALATIVQCTGSSPQKEGAKMLVKGDGSIVGTLGGGCIEADVIQAALTAIKDGSSQAIPFQLTEKHGGMICGGKILVYIETITPEPHIFILGAGHVGKCLSTLAKFAGFRTTVADDREEHANFSNLPDASDVLVNDFKSVFSSALIDKTTCVVIATRGHNNDFEALRGALRTDAGYIGLLGSRRKKALLFDKLAKEGFSQQDIDRVITPVGLPIGSVGPEEIAISIMAQIIQFKRLT